MSNDGSVRVSILATADAMVSPVSGLFETLLSVENHVPPPERADLRAQPFAVEIVAESAGTVIGSSGLTITAHRALDEVSATDVVIVPSMALRPDGDWVPGRYPRAVAWIRAMYEGGATLCTACSGSSLTAETGLLDGQEATAHWLSERSFRRRYPAVRLRVAETLVVAGENGRIVTSGAATAWHDLVLYLVARHVGPATAQALARFQLLHWHRDGQSAFQVFEAPTDHGDAAILALQRWLDDNYAVASPVDEMTQRSALSPSTFNRRFKAATGHTPIAYVQRVRVERAKRLLETGQDPLEEISWRVGYEDPASFRRLFKRLTGMTAAEYRHRFRIPDLPHLAQSPTTV